LVASERHRVSLPRAAGKYVSPGERAERGRAARKATPRRAHGEWEPAPDRADPEFTDGSSVRKEALAAATCD